MQARAETFSGKSYMAPPIPAFLAGFLDAGDDRGPQIVPRLRGWGGISRDHGDVGDSFPLPRAAVLRAAQRSEKRNARRQPTAENAKNILLFNQERRVMISLGRNELALILKHCRLSATDRSADYRIRISRHRPKLCARLGRRLARSQSVSRNRGKNAFPAIDH